MIMTDLNKSKIHGIGIFAREFLPKGTIVWEFNEAFDITLDNQEIHLLSDAAKEQFFKYAYQSKVTGKYILCSDDSRFFNHDLNANTKCEIPKTRNSEDALICYAVRDIQPGEELTNNYAEFDKDPYDVIL
jgi:SET domain-containing protein